MGLGGWRGGSQDVCLPMSRDSERKRRGEWDERREEGDRSRRKGEHLHTEKVSGFNRIIKNKLLAHVVTVKSAAVNILHVCIFDKNQLVTILNIPM